MSKNTANSDKRAPKTMRKTGVSSSTTQFNSLFLIFFYSWK